MLTRPGGFLAAVSIAHASDCVVRLPRRGAPLARFRDPARTPRQRRVAAKTTHPTSLAEARWRSTPPPTCPTHVIIAARHRRPASPESTTPGGALCIEVYRAGECTNVPEIVQDLRAARAQCAAIAEDRGVEHDLDESRME